MDSASPEGSLKNKWMNSVDSLDTVSSAASSSGAKQGDANNVTSEFGKIITNDPFLRLGWLDDPGSALVLQCVIFSAGNPEDRPDIDANFPGLNYRESDEPEPEPELPKVVGGDATVLNVPKRSTSMNSGSTTTSSSARWVSAFKLS